MAGGRDRRAAPGPAGAPAQDLSALVSLMTLKELKNMSNKKAADLDDLAGTTENMGGLKILRNMSRMRAVKAEFKRRPRKVVRDYLKSWEERLEAANRSWGWRWRERSE